MKTQIGAALVATVLAATGCVTGTAHRLPLANNPLREQASACETACRSNAFRPPARLSTNTQGSGDGATEISKPSFDEGDYGRCLDTCPGATAVDGDDCPDPPRPGEICVRTYKANPAGIAAGGAAIVSGLTVVLILVVVGSALAGLAVLLMPPV